MTGALPALAHRTVRWAARRIPRRAPDLAAEYDAVAEVCERVAVLLEAGLAPLPAWRAMDGLPAPLVAARAEPGTTPSDLADAVGAAADGAAVGQAWRTLGALWAVATESGAPLAPTLARAADLMRDLAEVMREVDLALAGPAATSRVVLALPAVGLAFAALLGIDVFGVLFGTPPGFVCLVAGAALVVGAVRWNGRMLAAARRVDPAAGLDLDAVALAVAGGSSPERAQSIVDAALGDAGLAPVGAAVARQLDFARRAGAPVAGLLRAEATATRRRVRASARRAAAELGVKLLLPLGLCVLPAFVLVGVAPVVIALLGDAVAGLG